MKQQITSYAFSILFFATLPTQAMDISNDPWALHRATKKNDVERVRLLIKGGYDVNKQDNKERSFKRSLFKKRQFLAAAR